MSETRYRISDKGLLVYFCDKERRWMPIECSYYQHYCGITCREMKVDGNRAILKCQYDVDKNDKMTAVSIELEE